MGYDAQRFGFTILMIYLTVFGVIMLVSLVAFILQGLGMYTLGKRRGMEAPWLAFIPYARVYYQGELCGPLTFKERQIKSPGIWMLIIPIVSNVIISVVFGLFWTVFVLKLTNYARMLGYSSYGHNNMGDMFFSTGNIVMFIGVVAMLFWSLLTSAIQKALLVIVNRQIYARYTDNNYAIIHAVLGIFIPLYTSIYFFIIRNRE